MLDLPGVHRPSDYCRAMPAAGASTLRLTPHRSDAHVQEEQERGIGTCDQFSHHATFVHMRGIMICPKETRQASRDQAHMQRGLGERKATGYAVYGRQE